MNKNDFRVQIPLWNITLGFILMYWAYGVIYAADLLFTDFQGVFVVANDGVNANWYLPGILSIIIGFFLMVVFFVIYFIKLKNYNQMNPNLQLHAFTFLKPGEFLEDDEMLRQVTENATKKIYIFYSQVLPLIILLIVCFPIDRYVYVVMLFSTMIIHNALYYLEIRKFLSGNYNLNSTKILSSNKFPKAIIISVIFTFILIVAIPIVRIVQIESNNKETLQEFKACVDEGRAATMEFEGNGFTSVKCK